MPDKFHNLLKSDPCISEKMMLRFLANSLNPAEQNRVERHLLECDFCNDAMEGLAWQTSLQTKESLDRIGSRIDSRISQKKTGASPRQWAFRIAATAVLISLFGGGLYYLQSIKKSEKVFAENFEPFHDTAHVVLSVEPVPAEEKEMLKKNEAVPTVDSKTIQNKSVQRENKKIARQQSEEKPTTIEQADQQIAATNTLEADHKEIATTSKDIKNAAAEKLADESKGRTAQKVNPEPAQQAMREITTNTQPARTEEEALRKKIVPATDQSGVAIVSPASTASDELINDGIKEYEAKNYSEAILMFSTALGIDRSNSEALFYNGVSYMSNNQNQEAIRSLESVVINSPNKYADAAKWYLSLVYIKEHKMSKAKNLLKELSENKNEYRDKAKKALAELN